MTELAERSGGLWRPSPGSVYPVLQQLQDEGLVVAEEQEGKKVFTLTDAGRELVRDNPEYDQPWRMADESGLDRARVLFEGFGALAAATKELARFGTPAQVERARAVLDDARRAMYGILAQSGSQSGSESGSESGPEYGTPSANQPGDEPTDSAGGERAE
jgi:DNA-binding PadR family transcriptional regulator